MIKSLFHGYDCNDIGRKVIELSTKYGGRGIIKSSKKSDGEYRDSGILTQGGPQLIKNQHLIYDVNQHKLKEIKNGIKCQKSKQYQNTLTKIKQTLENDISPLKFLESSYKTSNLQLVDYHSTNET